MRRSEIERMEAVGGEFSSLIRLWESVEKSRTPRSKKNEGWAPASFVGAEGQYA